MARKLGVYLNHDYVGQLVQDGPGDSFQYDPGWLSRPDSAPLSQSLPRIAEPFSSRQCAGFFGGILPEGEKREILARNLGITARNDVKMLELIGGECAGAVSFVPEGEALPADGNLHRALTDHELAAILKALPKHPLWTGENQVRLSLAGAQDKLAVYLDGAQIYLPLDGAPSTHILKPENPGYAGIVVNELLCMRLAQTVGLRTAAVTRESVEDVEYLLVERYDRVRTEGEPLRRLHQEDFCQALGVPSQNKYQNEGGPSLQQCFQLLRSASAVPALDVLQLLDAVIFNLLIGNNDAHAKNFSLLYTRRTTPGWMTSLAPLYDLICTTYYPELSAKMAMKIGGEYDSARVYPHHFDRLAEDAGLNPRLVRRRVASLAKAIPAKLPDITPAHPAGVAIAKIVQERCGRVTSRFAP